MNETNAAWLLRCAEFLTARRLDPRWLAPLAAFETEGPDRPAAGFTALEREVMENTTALSLRIAAALTDEVDAAQAGMFARRYLAVAERLRDLSQTADEARVLAVGLHQRTCEALDGPPPRALRVRAIADFYYSRAGVLYHALRRTEAGEPPLTLPALISGARWSPVAPGIRHATLEGQLDEGPAYINVLRVEAGAGRLRCVDCRGAPDFPAFVAERGAVAGVSGGFFLYSEPDIAPPSARMDPVGLLVSRGAVRSPPVLRRAALLGPDPAIAVVGPTSLRLGDRPVRIAAVNAPGASGVIAFNRAYGETSPATGGPAAAIVGDRVVASGRAPLPVPLAGVVLHLSGEAPPVGTPVTWDAAADDMPIEEGMAGGPVLVRGGAPAFTSLRAALLREDFQGTAPPRTFSGDETGDQNLLPRMAAGLTSDGALIFAAVDGRNFHRALGLTLGGLARLMIALGCERAMNLDGGSSKRMVIGDRTVDLASTEVVADGAGSGRVRPVHTAVLVHARAPGGSEDPPGAQSMPKR